MSVVLHKITVTLVLDDGEDVAGGQRVEVDVQGEPSSIVAAGMLHAASHELLS